MSEGVKRRSGLTANAVKHAKPRPKAYKLSDRDELYLLVTTTGIRNWRMNDRLGGQQRMLSFGRWPEILLGDPAVRSTEHWRLRATLEFANLDGQGQ